MHIILVANYGTAPRSFAVSRWHIALLVFVLLSALIGVGHTVQSLLKSWSGPRIDHLNVSSDVEPTLTMMAQKLGEMEAQLLRLDTFSDRLSKVLGPRLPNGQEAKPASEPKSTTHWRDLESKINPDLESVQGHLSRVALAIEERSQQMNRLESAVVEVRALRLTLPTTAPISDGYHSSDYGARRDPFDGRAAFHAGIDFVAPYGTRFMSAAAGVVVSTRRLPDYGNVIEIDHGNGIHTLYAHASKIIVQVGELVLKGQTIGEVGSTGRSTGPHLHFEVHENGQTTDPQKFLKLDS